VKEPTSQRTAEMMPPEDESPVIKKFSFVIAAIFFCTTNRFKQNVEILHFEKYFHRFLLKIIKEPIN